MRKLTVAALALALLLSLAACGDRKSNSGRVPETGGSNRGGLMEDVEDGVKDAARDAGDAVEDAMDGARDAVDDAKDAVDDALRKNKK